MTSGLVRASPAVASGKIVISSYDGKIYCFGNPPKNKPPEPEPPPLPEPPPPEIPKPKLTILTFKIGSNIMTIDGLEKTTDAKPTIIDGRTYLPARFVVEPLGGWVAWYADEKKVSCTLKERTLEMWVGKPTAKLAGKEVTIDQNPKVTPIIISGRTFVPIRFLCESLGCEVSWNEVTKTVTLSYSKVP